MNEQSATGSAICSQSSSSNVVVLQQSEDGGGLSHISDTKQQQQQGKLFPIQSPVSATPSPVQSPAGKTVGRNFNGTMVTTSTPSNEAELQLYRVLQKASLLAYYDTLLEMGGDDVQQLCDAGEEEFLEIMALVGMASKPLHVRRLQKALHEWVNNPSAFQTPLSTAECQSRTQFSPEHTPSSRSPFAVTQTYSPLSITASAVAGTSSSQPMSHLSNITTCMGSSTPPNTMQLTPALTDAQLSRLTSVAERLSRELPQLEPKAQNLKKRSSKQLEQIIAMNECDPRRMDEIRKYAAIYGRFDCKRKPEKPLTLHEVCVNEAAAQLCKYIPALLTRRDELFPLARQVVRDSGFGHSVGIARFAMGQHVPQTRSHESDMGQSSKRLRLASDTSSDYAKESASEETRQNLLAIYQKLGKTFDFSEAAARFASSYSRSEYDDADDSRFSSFSNSSSPPLHTSNNGDNDGNSQEVTEEDNKHSAMNDDHQRISGNEDLLSSNNNGLGVHVISASGGHIIAVTNPALALSPALNETLTIKRERMTPEI